MTKSSGRSPRIQFPDPRSAGEDGLLCFGGDLEVSTLLQAYRNGIFPWPQENLPLLWFSPFERGVLDFDRLHWSRRFLRALRKDADAQLAQAADAGPRETDADAFTVTFNRAFQEVIGECARIPRSHESGTWILPEMKTAFMQFHEAGYAHSVECWQSTRLVGGLYGVYVDGVFSGESMFHTVSDASKRCLFALTRKLRENDVTWMDIQMVTPVLEKIGGRLIPRDSYLARVARAQRENPKTIEMKGEFAWPSK